jgi:hypothetical protein
VPTTRLVSRLAESKEDVSVSPKTSVVLVSRVSASERLLPVPCRVRVAPQVVHAQACSLPEATGFYQSCTSRGYLRCARHSAHLMMSIVSEEPLRTALRIRSASLGV